MRDLQHSYLEDGMRLQRGVDKEVIMEIWADDLRRVIREGVKRALVKEEGGDSVNKDKQ